MRIFSLIVLIAGVFIVGAIGYDIGVSQAVGTSGQAPVWMPYYMHPFLGFGFGFLGFLFPLLFIFLIFGALRGLMWGGRGRWGGPGHWGGPDEWRKRREDMLDDWHKQAHGERTERPQGSGSPPSA